MPDQHMLHYFDIHHHRGGKWYKDLFDGAGADQVRGDATVTYARSSVAMERIRQYKKRSKIILILRNPIDRAWSHYWHEKKKDKIRFTFDEWQTNYDLYANWILPGQYDQHLKACDRIFSADQILVLFYDDILTGPDDVVAQTFQHLGVSPEHTSEMAPERINKTTIPPQNRRFSILPRLGAQRSTQSAFEDGPSSEQQEVLLNVFRPTIEYLEQRFGRNLNHWLTHSGEFNARVS